MNCKFCNAQLEEDVTVCPACGKNQAEELPEEVLCCEEKETVEATEALEAAPEGVEEALENATEEVAEETAAPKVKMSTGRILLIALCGALLLGILAVAIIIGSDVQIGPQGEGILYKNSYTVSDKEAVRNQNKVIARVNGAELTNGELQAHYFGNTYQFMDSYGTGYFDFNAPLAEQYFDAAAMTWQQYLLDTTIANWHRYQALAYLAQQEGFVADLSSVEELRAELEEAAIGYGFASADEMIHADMGESCTMEDYLNYISLMRGGNQFVEHYIAYLTETLEPTLEDLEAYYTTEEAAFIQAGLDKNSGNIVSVRHLLVMPKGEKGENGYSDAQWAEALAEAEKLYNQWKSGEATEESFAALATEFTEDTGSAAAGGLYEDITPYSSYVPNFLNWSVDPARQAGDTEIVETEYGYHIMYFVSGEPLWLRAARDNYPTNHFTLLVNQTMEEMPIKVTYRDIVVTDANIPEAEEAK